MKKLVLCALLLAASSVQANDFAPQMKEHFATKVSSWLNTPTVITAVKAQNQRNMSLTDNDINSLDQQWRAGVGGGDTALIDKTLNNELSAYLKQIETEAGGLYTEIFVMDNKGLNVGQSSMTSDYWQGDEDKFKQTYSLGAGAIFVDEVEEDESTQMFQSQMSATIVDENGNPIGAITIGINVDEL